jgi:hypothetical protein
VGSNGAFPHQFEGIYEANCAAQRCERRRGGMGTCAM